MPPSNLPQFVSPNSSRYFIAVPEPDVHAVIADFKAAFRATAPVAAFRTSDPLVCAKGEGGLCFFHVGSDAFLEHPIFRLVADLAPPRLLLRRRRAFQDSPFYKVRARPGSTTCGRWRKQGGR